MRLKSHDCISRPFTVLSGHHGTTASISHCLSQVKVETMICTWVGPVRRPVSFHVALGRRRSRTPPIQLLISWSIEGAKPLFEMARGKVEEDLFGYRGSRFKYLGLEEVRGGSVPPAS